MKIIKVNKINFDSNFKEFEILLKESEFYSIDLEYGGLGNNDSYNDSWIDTYDLRHYKRVNTVSNFEIYQMGITLFNKDKTS
ncbi:unnamed protein product, partial [marine sediment metagenome]